MVAEHDAVVEGDVVLDAAAVPDGDGTSDEAALTDDTVVSDRGTGHDVNETPYFGAGADDDVRLDVSGRVNKGCVTHREELTRGQGEKAVG